MDRIGLSRPRQRQRLARIGSLDVPVERPAVTETTALGAAYLAGLEIGLYPSRDAIAGQWQCERRFEPSMDQDRRATLYAGWRDAVRRTLSTT